MESVRSERPGYLPLDEQLWRLAGAHRREMWDNHKSAVMACFKVLEFDAQAWIYNERMVQVLEEQATKYRKKYPQEKRNSQQGVSPSISSSCSSEVAFELPPGIKARNERERLANLADAKKRGFQ